MTITSRFCLTSKQIIPKTIRKYCVSGVIDLFFAVKGGGVHTIISYGARGGGTDFGAQIMVHTDFLLWCQVHTDFLFWCQVHTDFLLWCQMHTDFVLVQGGH